MTLVIFQGEPTNDIDTPYVFEPLLAHIIFVSDQFSHLTGFYREKSRADFAFFNENPFFDSMKGKQNWLHPPEYSESG